jgi:hypothetical protein
MIEGTTDPGATVLINDERQDVTPRRLQKLVETNKIGTTCSVKRSTRQANKLRFRAVLVEE